MLILASISEAFHLGIPKIPLARAPLRASTGESKTSEDGGSAGADVNGIDNEEVRTRS